MDRGSADGSIKAGCGPVCVVRPPTKDTVGVIGAGLAGLSAAWHLHIRGFQTIVFDARGRVGGRVRTLRSPFRDGQYAEVGAARVGSDHTTTLKYVRKCGLSLESFYPSEGRVVLWQNGARREVGGRMPSHRSHALVAGEDPIAARPSVRDVLTKHLPWPLGPRRWFRISGGADRLPNAMAAQLPNVLMNTPVVGVEQYNGGATLRYLPDHGTEAVADLDYVICTAPLSVLDQLVFLPSLSEKKQRCMSRVGYQAACRCFFQVKERPWTARGCNGFGRGDLIGEIWNPTFDQSGVRGILVTYCQGSLAEKMANLSNHERIESTTAVLARVHPGIDRVLETAVAYHWNEDQWSRGAQSLAWDLSAAEFGDLARPEGRVHFAGEHTAPRRWLGWMNGALLSGERVAREIQRRANRI